jgi:2-methylisocitrate lyase-like PEP mutase family enzyme
MQETTQFSQCEHFKSLNEQGGLLLPNAWDSESAKMCELAGFAAIGTTSAGIAKSHGLPDGQRMARTDMLRSVGRIISAVEVPVSVDIEAGYGTTPREVSDTVKAFIDIGAAGINLEDNTNGSAPVPLFGVDDQVRRIAAAREAAETRGVPLVINARTDCYLVGAGENQDERFDMTTSRGQAYARAGADLIFVPMLLDVDVVEALCARMTVPVSLMFAPGAERASDYFNVGCKRFSLGPYAMTMAYAALRKCLRDWRLTGAWGDLEPLRTPSYLDLDIFETG